MQNTKDKHTEATQTIKITMIDKSPYHQFIGIKPSTNAKAVQALTGITGTYITE